LFQAARRAIALARLSWLIPLSDPSAITATATRSQVRRLVIA
jgi:hypothetical protein